MPQRQLDAPTCARTVQPPDSRGSTKSSKSYSRAAPLVEQSVNHGDLALMNALWDSGEVIALLDFEFAVLGPVEIDLCRLVCEARVSEEGQHVDSKAGAAALEIAARHMDPIHGRALSTAPRLSTNSGP